MEDLKAIPLETLTGSLREFRDPRGTDLFERVEGFYRWQDARRQQGFWPYSKSTEKAPLNMCAAKDDAGRRFEGVNFASQDYLSLSSHPAIKQAAKEAVEEYGVHSAGSAAFLGNTRYSLELQRTISTFLNMEHTVLYPTGWAAGYGVIRGLIRAEDHVVMDGLAHNCLQDGAIAATRNIHLHGHLNLVSVRRHLNRIRTRDKNSGILVITEGLFSMDSDTPDIAAMQELCREFNAKLMVDVAHDLGNIGEDGTGHIGLQQMLGKVDIVMGSFSKTFASNGGFVCVNSPAVREYLRYFGSSGTFSNALSPVQSAIVLKAFEIVQSEEGRNLRASLMKNVLHLRNELQKMGLEVIGNPSAIVSAKVGDEALARMVSQRLPELGVVANLVEFPAVAKGSARFRLQVMAKHTKENIDALIARLKVALMAAQGSYQAYRMLVTEAAQAEAQSEPEQARRSA
ncbi:MAG TPA: aminotransferase class I/II-fold pyridoxal phosphate-dependent enzyme [Micropepsaceae bacterium]|nr:aminotransferase class I/II-fold pyridoxal phosphate-dependent enzyme [Micropepsaceae bacterium]